MADYSLEFCVSQKWLCQFCAKFIVVHTLYVFNDVGGPCLISAEVGRDLNIPDNAAFLKSVLPSLTALSANRLAKYPLAKLPKFLQNNVNNYQEWID